MERKASPSRHPLSIPTNTHERTMTASNQSISTINDVITNEELRSMTANQPEGGFQDGASPRGRMTSHMSRPRKKSSRAQGAPRATALAVPLELPGPVVLDATAGVDLMYQAAWLCWLVLPWCT